MFQLMRRQQRSAVAVQIKCEVPHTTIVGEQGHCCAVCGTGGPFAWLAYRGQATKRRPIAWLCLHCLELGHSPYEFAAQARTRHADAQFVIFPGTSVEAEQDLLPPTDAVA